MLDITSGEVSGWLTSPAVELHPRASPDGGWVAYTSDVTGVEEVYVVRFGAPPEFLFEGPYEFSNSNDWDVLPDGRLVMAKNSNPEVGREVRVIMGWVEQVVPT